MITLKFINQEVDEPQVIKCDRASIPMIMEWYGAFYAGDSYEVFANGRRLEKDKNGCMEMPIIDVTPIVVSTGRECAA